MPEACSVICLLHSMLRKDWCQILLMTYVRKSKACQFQLQKEWVNPCVLLGFCCHEQGPFACRYMWSIISWCCVPARPLSLKETALHE